MKLTTVTAAQGPKNSRRARLAAATLALGALGASSVIGAKERSK